MGAILRDAPPDRRAQKAGADRRGRSISPAGTATRRAIQTKRPGPPTENAINANCNGRRGPWP
eukprot:366442-Lingulodinium_polyedra.AAC.1